jgi:hypothetical protein
LRAPDVQSLNRSESQNTAGLLPSAPRLFIF